LQANGQSCPEYTFLYNPLFQPTGARRGEGVDICLGANEVTVPRLTSVTSKNPTSRQRKWGRCP